MLHFRKLFVIGFLLFSGVTMYVATLNLTVETLSILNYLTIGGFGVGLLGLVIALAKAGGLGKILIIVVIGLGTAGVSSMVLFPRF